MELIRRFENLEKTDVAIAGGKGASLGEMTRAGIPVPPGFVVLSQAFDRFLDETDLRVEIDSALHAVKHEQMHTVEDASEKIRALIMSTTMPRDIVDAVLAAFQGLGSEYVAVRSSATSEDSADAAWAGQLESYLNTTEDRLLENVQACWASLFTPRAVFYRFEKGLHGKPISVAVVVQKMVESEISGVAFSVHPVTEDRNQLIIEASYGLGEAIVSGQVTPDSYVVEKEPRRIADVNVFEQERGLYRSASGGNEWCPIPKERGIAQVLPNDRILEFAGLVIRIERHYGFPCDIEWAFVDGAFYILQSRPITTLRFPATPQDETTEMEYSDAYRLIERRLGTFQGLIRLFRLRGVRLLVNDLYIRIYSGYPFLITIKNGDYVSYITKEGLERCHREGADPVGSEDAFSQYLVAFKDLARSTLDLAEAILLTSKVTDEDMKAFFDRCVRSMDFYKYTDFHFSDGAYERAREDAPMLARMEELGRFKNDMRDYLNDLLVKDTSALERLLRKIGDQTGIAVAALKEYTSDEVLNLLKNGTRIEDGIITERLQASILFNNDGTIVYLRGKEAEALFDRLVYEEDSQKTKTIRGVCASSGTARGTAKVITADYDDFQKLYRLFDEMRQGEILISETTSPDLMPACRKAAAIVTNQGGMVSHAAIVSREMGIPCVVGTRFATTVIKTGDEVEVDAERGIVRIIEK